jgi:hypothetical protein
MRDGLEKLGAGVFEVITAIHNTIVFGIITSQEADQRHGRDFARDEKAGV